jgi:predicted dehydrogenase
VSPASIRVAIVGAGLMGRWHAASARRAGAQVVAVADPDAARAAQLARRHGARTLGPTDRLAQHEVDAVHVCTPLETHAAIVAQILEAGLPVLVEKPLARDPVETERLLGAARAAGVVLCPVHQFPFQRGARRVLDAPDRLGALLHADYVACSAGGAGRDAATLSAIVDDILPHPLSLLRRLQSPPLHTLAWQVIRGSAGEVRASARAGTATLGIVISMGGRPTRNTLRLVGTQGTAHVDLFHGFATLEPGDVSRAGKVLRPFRHAGATLAGATGNLIGRMARLEPAYPGLRELVREFYRAVREGGPPPVSADEVTDVARTRALLAGHRS